MRVGLSVPALCFVGAILALPAAAVAQVQINQNFVEQGPAPSVGEFLIVGSADGSPGGPPDPRIGTVAGDVQAILLDPLLGPDTMFVGSPNGGIWRTTNGGANWTPLTDNYASLSIASLALDTTDHTGNTLVAGIGITSSGIFDLFNRRDGGGSGGLRTGVLYSTDGGGHWTALGSTELKDQSVIGVAARGSTIMAATFEVGNPTQTTTDHGHAYGLYISTNGGPFNLVPTCSPPCAGLPAGPVTSLVADPDPSRPGTFYAAVTSPTQLDSAGVFVTNDYGTNWAPVFTKDTMPIGATNVIAGATDQVVLKLASGPDGSVAIAVAGISPSQPQQGYELTGLYLSRDGGTSWSGLPNPDVPLNPALPPTNTVGGAIYKLGIAIDPNDTSIVYVSGDEVPENPFPSPVFRVEFQPGGGAVWTGLTCPITPHGRCTGSDPIGTAHADSRALAIDAAGNLLLVGDGGIYKLTNPQSGNGGAWTGLNATLGIRESYQVGYGAYANRLVVAAQDAGVALQKEPNKPIWTTIQGADGWVANVRDVIDPTYGPVSVYYTDWYYLGGFARLVVDSQGGSPEGTTPTPAGVPILCNNPAQGTHFIDCATATGNGSGEYNNVVLNKANPTLIALTGSTNPLPSSNSPVPPAATHVYVAEDTTPLDATRVDLTLTDLGATNPQYGAGMLAYGTSNDPNVLLAGNAYGEIISTDLVQGELYLWVPGLLGTLTKLPTYSACDVVGDLFCQLRPASEQEGRVPTSLVFGRSAQDFYVADSFNLWGTKDQGAHIEQLTGHLTSPDIAITRPTSLEFIDNNGVEALLVGGLMSCSTGVCASTQSPIAVADSDVNGDLLNWRSFGAGLPNTIIFDMAYNSLADVLAVGTVGRGMWTLYDVTSYFSQAEVLQFGLANNDSTPDAHYLTDGMVLGGGNGFVRPLIKYGTGTLTIAGTASYTGATTILGGTLAVNGSIALSASVAVNAGGALAGIGTVPSTTVLTGGALSPGNNVETLGTLTVAGSLLFQPGSLYFTQVAGQSATSTGVTGMATLAGTEIALFQPGSLINSYTILSAAGGRTGTFDTFDTFGLPSFVSASLGYTPTDATLDLASQIANVSGLTRNQRAVGGALDEAFNTSGGIPDKLNAALFDLPASGLPSALDALSGEVHATTSSVIADQSRYERDAILGRLIQAGYGGADTQVVALGTDNSITVASLKSLDDEAMGLGPRDTYVSPPHSLTLPSGPEVLGPGQT